MEIVMGVTSIVLMIGSAYYAFWEKDFVGPYITLRTRWPRC